MSNISAISSEFLLTPRIIALFACWNKSKSDMVLLVAPLSLSIATVALSVPPASVLNAVSIPFRLAAS